MSLPPPPTPLEALRRPSHPPPTSPLPPLPLSKTRSQPETPTTITSRRESSSSLLPTPASSRSVTPSSLPALRTPQLHQSTSIPTLRTTQNSPPVPTRANGRNVSIGSFPQPPKGAIRRPSQPSSPLSTPVTPSPTFGILPTTQEVSTVRRTSSQGGTLRRSIRRSSGYGQFPKTLASPVSSSSLLGGIGEHETISSAPGARGSEALLNLPFPPLSRPTSANGSESTHFEENDEERSLRGRVKSSSSLRSREKSDGLKEAKGNVIVSVRVRPDSGAGDPSLVAGEWMVDGRRSLISYKGGEGGEYRYDNVFSPHDNNARVYDAGAKRLIRRVMEGYHGTVFAYGMTGTGKTFSMQGTASSPGVIPLAITDIFSYIRENPSREFLLRVSYLEIYNEKIHDLLSPNFSTGQQQEEIKLREDSKRGVYATPLKEEIVQSPTQLLRVIARGDLARRTASTQFNARSSRSHAVVQIVVESRERIASGSSVDKALPGGVLVSTLSLIDLAGSEKAADNKERRTEGAHINKSLLTLGTVIARLSSEKDANGEDKEKHLPYRDSKLTRLLQPALSGNSLVSILCTVQLAAASGGGAMAVANHTGETLNTLMFASRAKNNIVSHAKRNESHPALAGDPGSRALLDRYRLEIEDLKKQLEQQNKTKDEIDWKEEDEERWRELERESAERHEEQMLEMQLARTALKERISHLNRLIISSKSVGVNANRFSGGSIGTKRESTVSAIERGLASGELARQAGKVDGAGPVSTELPVITRTMSVGSTLAGVLPAASVSQMVIADGDEDNEEADSAGADGDGTASAAQQIRALQSDVADKNRYIATLEKRLLHARPVSNSNIKHVEEISPHTTNVSDFGHDKVVRAKDAEIKELKARLDDQIKMVTALRNAARMRDTLDMDRSMNNASSSEEPATTSGAKPEMAISSPRKARRTNGGQSVSHRSQPSTTSSGGGNVNFSRLTPVALLSPTHGEFPQNEDSHPKTFKARKKSVDEVTRMLDEMISQKVESGRGGSLSVSRRELLFGKELPPSPLAMAAGDDNRADY